MLILLSFSDCSLIFYEALAVIDLLWMGLPLDGF
jgi:hypothetical protein